MFGRRRSSSRFQKEKHNPLSQQDSTCSCSDSSSSTSQDNHDDDKTTRGTMTTLLSNNYNHDNNLSLSSKPVNTFANTTITATTITDASSTSPPPSKNDTSTTTPNNNKTMMRKKNEELMSPSKIMPLSLRKLPFRKQKKCDTTMKSPLLLSSSTSTSYSSYPLHSSLPQPPTLDSNDGLFHMYSAAVSTNDNDNDKDGNKDDIESFHNSGSNPFPNSWKKIQNNTITIRSSPILDDNHNNNKKEKKKENDTIRQLSTNASSSSSLSSSSPTSWKKNRKLNFFMRKVEQEQQEKEKQQPLNPTMQSQPPLQWKKIRKLTSSSHDMNDKCSPIAATPNITSNKNDKTTILLCSNDTPQQHDFHHQHENDTDDMVLTRSALSRPFGRTSLPSHLAKLWSVEVSPYYDTSFKCWKYHIFVQREQYPSSANVTATGTVVTTTTTATVNGNSFSSPHRIHKNGSKKGGGQEEEEEEEKKNISIRSSPNSVLQPISSPLPSSKKDQILTNTATTASTINTSFTAANVTRTLKDIVWLERALKDEYHGALIFPALSMTLTSGTDWTKAMTLDKETFDRGEWDPFTLSNELLDVVLEEEGFYDLNDDDYYHYDTDSNGQKKGQDKNQPPFDPKLIADWFSDILNGVRGKGELILNYSNSPVVDVMLSESMESFFYKVNEPLVDLHFMKKKERKKNWLPINLDLSRLTFKDTTSTHEDSDDFQNCTMGLMSFPILCLSNMNSCTLQNFNDDGDSPLLSLRNKTQSKQHHQSEPWSDTLLSQELKVQSYYLSLQRENTLRAMYRLRILLETEVLLSAAWKRFAISLSNLFTAEKDIESCKVGGPKEEKKIPSNIGKDKVDNCLRMLARQKVERSTPSLKVLSGMLSAYYADLSAVNPSLLAFTDSLKQLENEKLSIETKSDDKWRQAFKAVSPLSIFEDPEESMKDSRKIAVEMQVFEKRQKFNESLINSSLLQLCNSIGIRISRMSWKFLKMESGQASLLSNAAQQVQENLTVDSHHEETLQIDNDENEIDILKRILDLGSRKKYNSYSLTKSCSSSHTGSDIDLMPENVENDTSFVDSSTNHNDPVQSALIEEVMKKARKQIGRWDIKLVKSILRGIGIVNLDISIDNCTREVRTIQRLAESLQAQINRCEDAILMLEALAFGDDPGQVVDHRREFLADLVKVFGTSIHCDNSTPPMGRYEFQKTLKKVVINFNDSAGWLSSDDNINTTQSNGCCGNVTSKYQEIRETGTAAHLKRMNGILLEQHDLVKRLESFVFMNWLGTHIEKHFSNLRSEALAAWEKKTDITTAINTATKKRLLPLVHELKVKLQTLSPITHTYVKEAKERHLSSKALKVELEALATNYLQKVKAYATNGVVKAILLWADYEENAATEEIKALSTAIQEIERSLRINKQLIYADGGAHLFASSGC